VPARPLDIPHTRPAQASLTLRPAGLLNRLKRPLSRGSSPAGYPTEPLVSYQINRQLSGWNLPPLVIRAFGAHGQSRRFGPVPATSGHARRASYEKWRRAGGCTPAVAGLGAIRGLTFGQEQSPVSCLCLSTPCSTDCAAWIGLTISGTKRPCIGNWPSRPMILPSRTRCLSWRLSVRRSPITWRII